jgi:AcrR family transcriptional regulator
MPKVSAAHEQEVRDRIVSAAIHVFADKGYRGATMADVVRESGLSVGAIYTYFSGKDELFVESCALISDRGLGELATRLAGGRSTAERLATAVDFFFESVDAHDGAPGQVALVSAWAEANEEPGVRAMLVRRREQLVGVGQVLIREGIARGELPAWIDVDALARAYTALLDGLVLQRIEAGEAFRREDGIRRARVVLELLLAAAASPRPSLPPSAS